MEVAVTAICYCFKMFALEMYSCRLTILLETVLQRKQYFHFDIISYLNVVSRWL